MFDAVIFDFGGVITESPFEAFNRLEAERGLAKDTIRRINAANPHDNAWARFERSEIDLDAFDRAFAAESSALGAAIAGRDVLAYLHGAVRPAMLEALRRISARYITGCITNNVRAEESAESWRGRDVAEAMSLFHRVIESSKVGIRKPDPRIYRMMIEALACDPNRAIYLDDLGINLKAAREMGMTTVKVEAAEPALRTLEELLKLTLR